MVKVEINAPLLEIGMSAVRTGAVDLQPIEGPVAPLCCTEGP